MTLTKTRFLTQLLAGFSILLLSCGAVSCARVDRADIATTPPPAEVETANVSTSSESKSSKSENSKVDEAELSTAIFAGGCFWCMEKPFDELPGVVETTSGYTGGTVENPSYSRVSGGGTGHYEAMEVRYDPKKVSYEQLLDTFWVNIDPLDGNGQFCDKGDQYRSAIFYVTPEQQQAAEASKVAIAERLANPPGGAIATKILPAAPFYDAEDYHQNYYQTHAVRYKIYRYGCGRDQRLAEVWGDDAPEQEK